jgi:hypothetical protein
MHVVALAERTIFIEDPAMWHFGFGGQDMERLVIGRERIYLDRFWNELSRDPRRFDEAKRQHYAALYAQPGAMRAGFAQGVMRFRVRPPSDCADSTPIHRITEPQLLLS